MSAARCDHEISISPRAARFLESAFCVVSDGGATFSLALLNFAPLVRKVSKIFSYFVVSHSQSVSILAQMFWGRKLLAGEANKDIFVNEILIEFFIRRIPDGGVADDDKLQFNVSRRSGIE